MFNISLSELLFIIKAIIIIIKQYELIPPIIIINIEKRRNIKELLNLKIENKYLYEFCLANFC